jgi:hypothetical protein
VEEVSDRRNLAVAFVGILDNILVADSGEDIEQVDKLEVD